MIEAEHIAQELDKEQIDTVRRDMLNHDAAALLRSQAAEIERLREALRTAIETTHTRGYFDVAAARAALENKHD